jgi:hypothetical protein
MFCAVVRSLPCPTPSYFVAGRPPGGSFFGAPQCGHCSGRRDQTRHFGHCVCTRSSEITAVLVNAGADAIPEAIVPYRSSKSLLSKIIDTTNKPD